MKIQQLIQVPVILIISICICHSVFAFQQSGFQTEAVGIQVFRPKADDELSSMILGQSPGTTIVVKISTEDHHIIGFGERESVKLEISDDKNAKLSEFRDTQAKYYLFKVAEDGNSAIIHVSGMKVPSQGATKLMVSGSVEVVTGRNSETKETAFQLKKGAKFKLGNIPCEIKDISDSFDPEFKSRIQLESNEPFDALTVVKFMDKQGKEIESRYSSGGSFSFGSRRTYTRSYVLKSGSDEIKAKVSFFSETETIELPIELVTGLGF